MTRFSFLLGAMLLSSLLSGCTEEEHTSTSQVEFLSPEEGTTVAAGPLSVSVVIEHFTLAEAMASRSSHRDTRTWSRWLDALLPGTPALAHNEGEAEGYCILRLNGEEVAQMSTTQQEIDVAAGSHTLEAELVYTDGDPLDPPVTAQVTFTAQ